MVRCPKRTICSTNASTSALRKVAFVLFNTIGSSVTARASICSQGDGAPLMVGLRDR